MAKLHDFRERLKWSESGADEPFWDAVYRKAFPGMVNHMLCSGDTESQRLGVDRLIFLGNNRTIRIDEKKREKTYTDILLEYISSDATKAPGWIEKDMAIDYIAYAFMDTCKVHLLAFPILRLAWMQYGDEWKRKYNPIRAQNKGYSTWSVPVPIAVLQKAMVSASIITVESHLKPVAVTKEHKIAIWRHVKIKEGETVTCNVQDLAKATGLADQNIIATLASIAHDDRFDVKASVVNPYDCQITWRKPVAPVGRGDYIGGGESKNG